ncbi:CopG family transcriptional regulator [Mesorhizobium sp. WSM3224]|uniref:ribbon-helix-helix domain-containing protein n=1 Tax=Mesorhizobium sp. WSM3224 TaxID=1040986 RepID=UPI0003FA3177|nr:CopG family transcriptional regulator [Mesorhizobium sp. WSM3224]
MTRRTFAQELESAADRIGDISRADLQIILRRAALIIRNSDGVSLEASVGDALDSLAGEMRMSRADLIRFVLREWLETNAYLPVPSIDEDSQTNGNA